MLSQGSCAGIYPQSQEGFERLDTAVAELTLNDGSVAVKKETSTALGPGFRCGFLGSLHMDVFMQRLAQEHGEEVQLLPFLCIVPLQAGTPWAWRITCAHGASVSER